MKAKLLIAAILLAAITIAAPRITAQVPPGTVALRILIPQEHALTVLDAMSLGQGWTPTIQDPENPEGPEIPNPVTKRAFANDYLKQLVRSVVRRYTRKVAETSALNQARDDADEAVDPITVD